MNIAILIQNLDIKGGTQHQLLELAHHLINNNNKVTVYTHFFNADNCYSKLLNGIKIISIKNTKNPEKKIIHKNIIYILIRILIRKIYSIKLSFLINKETDIINPHQCGVLNSAFLFKIFHPKVKISWFCNEIPVGEISYLNYKKNKKSIFKKLFIKVKIKYYKILLEKVNSIAVNDNRNKKLLNEIFNKDAVNVGIGVDINKFFPKNLQKSFTNKTIKIFSIGVLFPYRKFENLIEAIGIVYGKNFKINLTIVGNPTGDPIYAKKLYDLIKKRELFNIVQFIDSINEKKLVELYQESDIFIWPCDMNTYGLAVIEAMACGLPVIVSNTTGVAEILKNYETGLIIPPNNPKLIADKIIFLINNNQKSIEIGKNAREFTENNLTWQHFTGKMEKLFKN